MKETFRCEYVKCGKKCGSCPHGPYWYAYWREGKRTRKRYVGKDRPDQPSADQGDDKQATPKPWQDAIYDRATANLPLACRILGIEGTPTRDATFRAYRQRMATAHPDRGGSEQEASWVNAAFTWLRVRMGW